MIFGNKNIYAIEIHHKPLDNGLFYMTSRLCIHLFNKNFGNINEEDRALAEPYMILVEKINDLNILEYDFNLKNDYDIFNFLDDKLYINIDRTLEQIKHDYKLYHIFNFMTNMGEMFNNTKSFIYMDKNKLINILFQIHDNENKIFCSKINKENFIKVSNDFIKWYEKTEKNKK